jgi:hypothetical protein
MVRARRPLTFALLLLSLRATSPAQAEAKVYPLDGRLYAEIGGYVSAPTGPMTREFDQITGGASFQFGVGLKGIPATLGIGMHQTEMGSTTWATGESGYFSYSGNSGYGDLYLRRALDVRGVDLVFRLEPERWWIRPFLEIRGGILQIWCKWSLATSTNSELLGEEKTGDIGWSWAYGGGLRMEPFRVHHFPAGDIAWFVSFGMRQVHAGPLRYLEPRGSSIGGVYTYTFSIVEPSYRALEFFLLLGFESRSP